MVLLLLIPPLLIAVYTWNYGRWAWRRNLRRGAVGLYLLSAASIFVPALVLLRTR